MKHIQELLRIIQKKNLYPDVKVIQGISSLPKVMVGNTEYLQFCSANYLGLATNPDIILEIKAGLDKYGIHPMGSRLISGTQDIHIKLETRIAQFKKTPAAIAFVGGVMVNLGVIPAVVNLPIASITSAIKQMLHGQRTCIFSDEQNHASIIDGIKLSKAKVEIYKHTDVSDLERRIEKYKKWRKLIITDGVFSMYGDIAPLSRIVEIAKEYGAMIMVDDAHGTGIIGTNGRGTAEHLGVCVNDIDINMGTFSKAFGVSGGFVAGDSELIDYLRVASRTYMFTGGFLGSLACGVMKAIEIVENGDELRKRLWDNTTYLRENLNRLGFNTLGSQTPIVSVLVGDESRAISFYNNLYKRGIFAPCFRWPAVNKGEAIIRFTVTSLHTRHHIDFLLNVLEDLKLH